MKEALYPYLWNSYEIRRRIPDICLPGERRMPKTEWSAGKAIGCLSICIPLRINRREFRCRCLREGKEFESLEEALERAACL